MEKRELARPGTRLIRDLLSSADGFYDRLLHTRLPGYRLYPPFVE